MTEEESRTRTKWYSKGRWALIMASIGVVIVAYEAATRGTHGAWMMWIAVPLLMISLGYLFVVNAVSYIWGVGPYYRKDAEREDEHSKE